jgi:hypothetical protein
MPSEARQAATPDRLKGRRLPYAVITLLAVGVPATFGWWASAVWALSRLVVALGEKLF